MARNESLPGSKRAERAKRRTKNKREGKRKRTPAVGRVLIVCEGEKTEPNYFGWWKKQLKKIKSYAKSKKVGDIDVKRFDDEIMVEGMGKDPLSVVEYAEALKNKASIDYKKVWCVFDRDSFPQYNDAIEKAYDKGFGVAYSNEAFELWYLLHFDYLDTSISRNEYKRMLEERLGKEYKKNDPEMYEKLLDHSNADQQRAINWAERLLRTYDDRKDYADHNPSTTVFKLVESLNEHVWQFRCQVAPDYPLPYPHSCNVCKKSTQPPPPYPYLKPS